VSYSNKSLYKRIAELQQELLKKRLKVHEALRLRDLANEHIAELEAVIDEVKTYLVAASGGSMSRNNSESLADEMLDNIKAVQSE
jgi:hypothetical protein